MEPLILEHKLGRVAEAMAAVLAPGHAQSALAVETLKTSDIATTLRLTLGNKTAIAKVFEAGADDAFRREWKALDGFHKGPVPRLLFVSQAERILMMSEIAGRPFADGLTAETLVQRAEFLGQWFGRLANQAPTEARSETWHDYLQHYERGLDQAVLAAKTALLSRIPVNLLILSHNDNALSNFVIGTDKRLYGLDFADARMKPEGWDLVTAARTLFRRFPDDLPIIANSLIRGYTLTRKGARLDPQFDAVIATIVTANLLADA